MLQRRDFVLAVLAVAVAAVASEASAQSGHWPRQPVKLVLSQPAGSGPDNVARLLSDRLAKSWGQAVVIDNKPGGQNTIGAQAAARSPADGHHFYFATTAALVSNRFLFKQLPYDPVADFVPVAFVARSPFAVLVKADSPITSFDDLLARAQAAPGKLSIANEGPRTFSGMIARRLNARGRIEANLVSYASVGVAVQDTLGGHVDALVADLASTAALARDGKLRVLAVTAPKRIAGWDAVPALAERWPGFEMSGWFAVVAPTGTPDEALQRANRDINAALAEPELARRIAAIGPLPEPGLSAAEVAQFLRAEHSRWAGIAAEIGLLPE
jgi:tripartite-type tricarboxylate transporter receptor subunit TctC